jgi:hypothetical protein
MPKIRIRIGKDGRTTFAVEGAQEDGETVISQENVKSLACVKLTQALEEAVGQVEERKLCTNQQDVVRSHVTEKPHETI